MISNRKLCRSPSYYRRQSRRRAERNTSNNVSCVIPESTAEQAEKKALADESCVVENTESDDASVVSVLKDTSCTEKIETLTVKDSIADQAVSVDDIKSNLDKVEVVDQNRTTVREDCSVHFQSSAGAIGRQISVREEVAPFDEKLSAIENLSNLTRSLDAIYQSRNSNTFI